MRLSPSIAILRTQSDERLVTLARRGSENAFQAIAERYRRALHGACRRVLSESRAEDAVQQAFMAAWVALQRGDDVLDLRSWLLMIARNTALNALRAPGYDFSELSESLVTSAAPQDELERREVMRQTLAGLAALPERQREALLRSAVAGVAYADIARDLGLSEGAARQLVLRARTTMRSAATALVPWPLAQWVATTGRPDGALRIAELATATGGAGVGASALLAKAGVVAVVAGGVAAGPAVLHQQRDAVPRARAATRTATHAIARAPAAISPAHAIAITAAVARTSHATAGGSTRAQEGTSSGREDGATQSGSHAGDTRDGDHGSGESGDSRSSRDSGSPAGRQGGDGDRSGDAGGHAGSHAAPIGTSGSSEDALDAVRGDSSGPGSDDSSDPSGSRSVPGPGSGTSGEEDDAPPLAAVDGWPISPRTP